MLVENLNVLKNYKLILCGNTPLSAKINAWLDGSGMDVHMVNEPEGLSGLPVRRNHPHPPRTFPCLARS